MLALVEYPELLKHPNVSSMFPSDVIARAEKALANTPGGIGAYSHSQGLPFVRKEIADFIARRDGYPCDPNDLFLYNGASPAVQDVLRLLIRNESDGVFYFHTKYLVFFFFEFDVRLFA